MKKFISWEPKGCPVLINFPEQMCLGEEPCSETELVGNNFCELQWDWGKFSCSHELSHFWRINKSDLTFLIFPIQVHFPLNTCKLLHSSLNTWPNYIPFALLKSTSFPQLHQWQIPVTCNENKLELLVLSEVFPFRNILNNTHLPCST